MTINKIPFWRRGWFKALALLILVAIGVFAVMAYKYQAALFPEPTYDQIAPELPAMELETKILIFPRPMALDILKPSPPRENYLKILRLKMAGTVSTQKMLPFITAKT